MVLDTNQGNLLRGIDNCSAMFDFIITEMAFQSEFASALNWKNIAGPKTETSF